MKKCIHCGKELPQDASWCPYCENAQSKPEMIRIPVRHHKKILACLGVLALLGIFMTAVFFRPHKAKTYEGEAEINYQIDGQNCRVFLSFMKNAITTGESQSKLNLSLAENDTAAIPSQLFAFADNYPNIQEAFKNEIESCTVTAEPLGNNKKVQVVGPEQVTGSMFSGAWKADIQYTADIGTNKICWEVRMKNGDVLHLSHKLTCSKLEVIEYHYEDTPMETIEEIDALIKKTAAESSTASVSAAGNLSGTYGYGRKNSKPFWI